jgi:hypothetical protein
MAIDASRRGTGTCQQVEQDEIKVTRFGGTMTPLTQDQHQSLADVANLITPSSWNVFMDQKDERWKPGTLNIRLWIHEYNGDDDPEDEWIGKVHGPQRYYRISFFAKMDTRAAKALRRFGDGVVASTEIWLREEWLGLETLIHELAHVAVQRYSAWKKGAHKNPDLESAVCEEEHRHGPLFQRFYRTMINRAERYLCEELSENRGELRIYESSSAPGKV